MKQDKLLKNIFTANILFDDNVAYRRIIIINTILILAMISFSIFAFLNILVNQNYFIAFLNIITFLASLVTFLHLRKNKNIPQAALVVSLIIIIFISIFTIENQNSHLGIIWTIFPAYFAILVNGRKIGILLIIPFYLFISYISYLNIGVWDEGNWAIMDILRLMISLFLVTSISYIAELAYDMSDKELTLVRENEAKILKKLKKQTITDGLTNIYNRRYFNEVVPKIIKNAQRNGSYISFFILDIDYFKNYNDFYGHQAGDKVLQKVAKVLKEFVQREDDFVFRIGGEEFAGVLHVEDAVQSKEWLENLNTQILKLNIEHKKSLLEIKKLTVSIGVYTKLVTNETDIDYYYKIADDALYKAKETGKNKTVLST